jgi:hypothetical protein
MEVVFTHLALWVGFVIGCIEESDVVHAWLKQRCRVLLVLEELLDTLRS